MKHVPNAGGLNPLHGKSLATARLPISKTSDHTFVEKTLNARTHHTVIKNTRVFLLPKSIIQLEINRVDVLCDSIDLHLRLMHPDLRVAHADRIEIAFLNLLLENWSLSHTDANSHIGHILMRLSFRAVQPVLINHLLIRSFSVVTVVQTHLSGLLSLLS